MALYTITLTVEQDEALKLRTAQYNAYVIPPTNWAPAEDESVPAYTLQTMAEEVLRADLTNTYKQKDSLMRDPRIVTELEKLM